MPFTLAHRHVLERVQVEAKPVAKRFWRDGAAGTHEIPPNLSPAHISEHLDTAVGTWPAAFVSGWLAGIPLCNAGMECHRPETCWKENDHGGKRRQLNECEWQPPAGGIGMSPMVWNRPGMSQPNAMPATMHSATQSVR